MEIEVLARLVELTGAAVRTEIGLRRYAAVSKLIEQKNRELKQIQELKIQLIDLYIKTYGVYESTPEISKVYEDAEYFTRCKSMINCWRLHLPHLQWEINNNTVIMEAHTISFAARINDQSKVNYSEFVGSTHSWIKTADQKEMIFEYFPFALTEKHVQIVLNELDFTLSTTKSELLDMIIFAEKIKDVDFTLRKTMTQIYKTQKSAFKFIKPVHH